MDLYDILIAYITSLFPKKYLEIRANEVNIHISKTHIIALSIDPSYTKKSIQIGIKIAVSEDVLSRYHTYYYSDDVITDRKYMRIYNTAVGSPKFDPDIKFKKIKEYIVKYANSIKKHHTNNLNTITLSTKLISK